MNPIRIKREELLSRLQSVQPGLSQTREIVEQSSCFCLRDGEVMTYNDEVSCRANSRLGSKITGAVKAKPLLDLLAKLTEDEVELEVSDGELVVSGARKRAGIRMEAEVMLAVSSVEEPGEWRKLPEDFDEALKIVFSCVGNDDTRFHLTCIHFAPEFIEACDNRQMARYTMDLGVEKDFLIRHAAMKQVNTLGMTEISESEAWVHFRNDNGLVMSCRRYVEEFPDLAKVIEMEGEPAVLPGGLAEAVEKAQIFAADSDDKKVLVELRPGKLRIKGEGNSGWFQEVKNIKYKGPDLNFRILPKLLAELCKRHNECEIAEDRLKVDGGKFVYVSCLSKADTKEVESNE